jgi:hypothetical protein
MLKGNIVSYIKQRATKSMEEIKIENLICEADAYILEIGYQCYLKKLSLDVCLEKVKQF